jgi:hypothetical protein
MISDINLTYQGGLSPKMLPNARGWLRNVSPTPPTQNALTLHLNSNDTETHFELQTSFETLSNVVENDKLTMASQWRLCWWHVRGFRDWHKSSFFGTSPPITHEIWCTQKS